MSDLLTTTTRVGGPVSRRTLAGRARSCAQGEALLRAHLRRDARRCWIDCPPESAFRVIQRIGGETGWYAFDRLWRMRARLDGLLGGVGLRRGRRHPNDLRVGDRIDWWRVEAFEPGRQLRLRAETRLPGEAWLTLQSEPCGDGVLVHQTLDFIPGGVLGRLYWALLRPLHDLVFDRMLRGIAAAARREAEPPIAPHQGGPR